MLFYPGESSVSRNDASLMTVKGEYRLHGHHASHADSYQVWFDDQSNPLRPGGLTTNSCESPIEDIAPDPESGQNSSVSSCTYIQSAGYSGLMREFRLL
jgi:hypothetical protein